MDVDINASAGISQSKIAGLVDDLAGKAPTSHTHTAAQISDSGTAGRAVLTAETPSAARSAIGAGTSSLTLGTTGTTACAGNDPRLADQRVPTDSSVTSAKIADGTIVDGDISPSAAIALSKLAAGRVAGSDNAGARTLTIWVGTEAQYTAIGTKDANTLYFRTA
ncbi:phage upper tail fiber protein [Rhodococcus ruber]